MSTEKNMTDETLPIEDAEELIVDQGLIDASSGAAEGTIYIGYAQPSGQFKDAFFNSYKVMPDIPAANFYDGIKLLAQSLRESDGSVSGAKTYLSGLKDFRGACGTLSFDHGITVMDTSIYQVKSDKSQLVH